MLIVSDERAFLVMNIMMSPYRYSTGDQWLNDSLVVYIGKYVLILLIIIL